MRLKSLAFAALGLLCSAGFALAAQEPPPGPGPVDPAQLQRLAPKQASMASASQQPLGGGGVSLNAVGNVALGWNYFHATNCQWLLSGSNNYLYVFPSEGGFWYVLNNIYGASTFLTPCTQGYWAAVHVINSTTGAFDAIYTYPFK